MNRRDCGVVTFGWRVKTYIILAALGLWAIVYGVRSFCESAFKAAA